MDMSRYKRLTRLQEALAGAEQRKAHYEDRLAELMQPRRNEAARRAFVDQVAEDLNEVMREIATLRRKIEEVRG